MIYDCHTAFIDKLLLDSDEQSSLSATPAVLAPGKQDSLI